MSEKIKQEFSKANRIRIIIANGHYINLAKIINDVNITIRTDEQTVINTLWLLRYHYNVNITDSNGVSFL